MTEGAKVFHGLAGQAKNDGIKFPIPQSHFTRARLRVIMWCVSVMCVVSSTPGCSTRIALLCKDYLVIPPR